MGKIDIAWCPGCGDYGILTVLKSALTDLKIDPRKLVMVSGIGQAAKIPQYLKCNYFNGLHGRALPTAWAIKAANPELTVIAESGDGCTYGEGGNHFLTAIRRNPDITHLVHNNMIYGLTKGQASPTSREGFVTPLQIHGVILSPFNPLTVAIALNATFVARASIHDIEGTKTIIRQAISHRGYALVDIFQPCVSFNHINTREWYRDNTYYLEESYDPSDRNAAFARATEEKKFPLGVLYIREGEKTYEDRCPAYRKNKNPLYKRSPDPDKLHELIESMK
jgi:2-oxoglutarate/2-oxoacid ferredoxin oxidoreductase subunit beta